MAAESNFKNDCGLVSDKYKNKVVGEKRLEEINSIFLQCYDRRIRSLGTKYFHKLIIIIKITEERVLKVNSFHHVRRCRAQKLLQETAK